LTGIDQSLEAEIKDNNDYDFNTNKLINLTQILTNLRSEL